MPMGIMGIWGGVGDGWVDASVWRRWRMGLRSREDPFPIERWEDAGYGIGKWGLHFLKRTFAQARMSPQKWSCCQSWS